MNKKTTAPLEAGAVEHQSHDRKTLDQRIVELRESGKTYQQIAAEVGRPLPSVYTRARRLMEEGQISSGHIGSFWKNLSDKRTQTIIKMVKEGASLRKIGVELGCTGERIRQLINHVKQLHGDTIFEVDHSEQKLTVAEAAAKLGVSTSYLSALCSRLKLPTGRRGDKKRSPRLFTPDDIASLRAAFLKEKTCVICKERFTPKKKGRKRMTCSDECSIERKRRQRESPASFETLRGWQKVLWQRLQSRSIRKEERWLTITGAAEWSGLSLMQLSSLRMRSVVTIQRHPTKKNNQGEPVALYAASEMDIAREVLEDYKKNAESRD